MTSSSVPDSLKANDLPLALYLNQRMVFDALASLEGGFSHFTTVHESSTDEAAVATSSQAKLGISNVFAFLGVQLGGQHTRQSGHAIGEAKSQELVHTPVSLFSRLRQNLRERGLIQQLESEDQLSKILTGDFVEFEAVLRRSPLVEFIEAFDEIYSTFVIGATRQGNTSSGKQRNRSKNKQEEDGHRFIKVLKQSLTEGPSQDLIAEREGFQAVLTTERSYFSDPSMNDIIDGTFRVFGKVIRIVPVGNCESIGLLRKTAFGKFDVLEQTLNSLKESVVEVGFRGSLETRISGPVIQVIPIAVFS